MVNLKDLKVRMWIAMRECVQACSQQNILANAMADSLREIILSHPVADDDPCEHLHRKGLIDGRSSFFKPATVAFTQKRDCDWIVQYQPRGIIKLMRRSANGNTKSSAGWFGESLKAHHRTGLSRISAVLKRSAAPAAKAAAGNPSTPAATPS